MQITLTLEHHVLFEYGMKGGTVDVKAQIRDRNIVHHKA